MGTWTLTHAGTTRPLKEWGLSQCVITEQSLTAGSLTAQIPGDMLATLPWSFEDPISLELDGVVQWRGVALTPERSGAGFSEQVHVRFADPWWYLSQAPYVQPWYVAASGTTYDAPRVALFAGITPGEGWVKRTIAEDIADVISQCNAYFGGSVMQLGDLLGDGFEAMPIPQRVNNVTFESVLRQILAWVPDAIQQWDYTTTPPTISFVQRAAATARSYASSGVVVEKKFIRRDDLAIRGMEITYAGLDAFGFVTKVIDQAGATTGTRIVRTVIDCTGNASGAAVTTPNSTPAITREYTVVSEAIAPTDKNWWFEYGDTGAQSADDITVLTGSMDFAPNAPENAGKTDLGGCGLQWLEGGIPKSRVSANTRVALVTGDLIITTTKTEASGAAPVTVTETKQRRTIKMLVPVTKLSGDYTQVIAEASSGINDAIPKLLSPIFITPGMAAALLAAWSTPQHDGMIKITSGECNEPIKPGDVLNLTGGLAEWATMATQVHGVTREIDTGITTVQTGVAAHLGVEEYANLIRMTRLRTVPAMDMDQQAMGQVPVTEPDPNEQDDMVGPGNIKYSVLDGQQKTVTTTANAIHTADMTADGGPKIINKDTGSGDEVVTTPGKQTVQNEAGEKTNTSTPDKQSLASGATDKAELSVADGLKLTTETGTAQLSVSEGLKLTAASGFTVELSAANGLLMTDSGLTLQVKPGLGLVISDGTGSTIVNLLQLLHNDGAGKTALVNAEQLVLSTSTKTGTYGSGSLNYTQGGGSVDLDITDGLVVVADGLTAKISGAGGVQLSGGGSATSTLSTGGLYLADGSNGVTVETQDGQAISFQDTDGCDVDEGGEPVTTTMKVLRGAAA